MNHEQPGDGPHPSSPGVGDALLRGLGTLDQAITAEKLAAALRVLLVEVPGMNTEQAFKRARRLRDELDAAGIFAREKQARDDTTWSLWWRADGRVTLHALRVARLRPTTIVDGIASQ